jgi:hypothetical protein
VRCFDGKWGRASDAAAARFVGAGDAGMCGVKIGRDGTVRTAVIGDAPKVGACAARVGGGFLIVGSDGLIVRGEREELCAVRGEGRGVRGNGDGDGGGPPWGEWSRLACVHSRPRGEREALRSVW